MNLFFGKQNLHIGLRNLRQVIDCLELLRQVEREVLRVWCRAGYTLHEIFGEVDRANGIHSLLQPLQDEAAIASRQALIEVWELCVERVEDLRGVEIAEGVCREVAEASGPVNILQHALSIVCGLYAQVFTVLCIPQARQRLDGNLA